MEGMKGFVAKKRSGGSLSTKYDNNCGHPMGSQNKTVSPEPKKILTGKVTDKPGLPKDAKL